MLFRSVSQSRYTFELEDLGEAEEIELTPMFHNQSGYSRIKVKDMGVVDKMIEDQKLQLRQIMKKKFGSGFLNWQRGLGLFTLEEPLKPNIN